MENTYKFTRVWDEEKGKFVFKPAEEAPEPNWSCAYGDYVQCEEDEIKEAKAVLLEQMIDTVRELAKNDEFWIVKKVNGLRTVSWKAEFPQMLPKENHTNAATRKDMTFGDALDALKQGKRIARKGWNGKNMSVAYQKGYPDGIPCNKNTAQAWGMQEGELFKCRPYLQMRCADGTFQMWLASQSDILADDWYIVE